MSRAPASDAAAEDRVARFVAAHERKELLRFLTCGSVDDGKSTLIGRLLYECAAIHDDQLRALRRDSRNRPIGDAQFDPSLLTDGLKAEREQGITIDVAYRYFSTPRRKFIIADTPGHQQYTRNMATGASNCDLAVVLVDAQKGVVTQTRRHSFIASLLGIRHLVVAVNKMDLVGWSEDRFEEIRETYVELIAKLGVDDIRFVPMSALKGDNVTSSSAASPWYTGGTLLHHLETAPIVSRSNLIDFRFPIQRVIRLAGNYRGYAGTVAAGILRTGEELVALPSGKRAAVKALRIFDGEVAEARSGEAVVVELTEEIDLSRGDMLIRAGNAPKVLHELDAMIVWMDEAPLDLNREYTVKHTTQSVPARFLSVRYSIDVGTLHHAPAERLGLNDIGRCELQTARPLFVDPYRGNRATGSFIVVDRVSNATVAAGMVLDRRALAEGGIAPNGARSSNTAWHRGSVTTEETEARLGQRGAVVWLTGLSGAGKSTIARALERGLFDEGRLVVVLDGDNVRHGLCGDLGFSQKDRQENIRRVAHVAELFRRAGMIVIVAFISPYRVDRDRARSLVPAGRFFEIHVATDVKTCESRDPKGLYAKARRGEIPDFTGISAPYEPPSAPELVVDTVDGSVEQSADCVSMLLRARGII